jgi:hypothetical protein
VFIGLNRWTTKYKTEEEIMRSKTMYLGLILIAFMSVFRFDRSMTTSSNQAYAQTSLPLVQLSNLVYQGAFRVPQGSSDQTSFNYGGTALGYNPANNSLFIVGHDWYQLTAEISVPPLVNSTNLSSLNTATRLQSFADVTDGKSSQIGGSGYKMGGHLLYGGRLYATAFIYYDASYSQTRSHFASGTNLSVSNDAQGPHTVGTMNPGFVSGYMATIPSEWQSAFGGPALTGNCCLSIISRTSWGPGAFVFNPSDLGVKNPVPAMPVVYYDQAHPTLGVCEASNTTMFNCTTHITGLVFPPGTRSVLFFGRQGTGSMCYDTGQACNDPADGSKGWHAYPYQYQVWAYDANDLLAVKNGQKHPWDIRPYAVWGFNLPFESSSNSHELGGAAYDPATQRIYIAQRCVDTNCSPIIQVLKVNIGTPPSSDTMPPSPPTAVSVQ